MDTRLKGLHRLARTLDSSIRLPGGYRIGLDGIIGLVPVAGDSIGAALSSYIVIRAAQLGASIPTLISMMFNILIETLVGGIPLLGDLFDFAFKSNERNMALLERRLPKELPAPGARKRLATASLILIVLFFALLILIMVLIARLFMALLGL
jgi:hypothetical protein